MMSRSAKVGDHSFYCSSVALLVCVHRSSPHTLSPVSPRRVRDKIVLRLDRHLITGDSMAIAFRAFIMFIRRLFGYCVRTLWLLVYHVPLQCYLQVEGCRGMTHVYHLATRGRRSFSVAMYRNKNDCGKIFFHSSTSSDWGDQLKNWGDQFVVFPPDVLRAINVSASEAADRPSRVPSEPRVARAQLEDDDPSSPTEPLLSKKASTISSRTPRNDLFPPGSTPTESPPPSDDENWITLNDLQTFARTLSGYQRTFAGGGAAGAML